MTSSPAYRVRPTPDGRPQSGNRRRAAFILWCHLGNGPKTEERTGARTVLYFYARGGVSIPVRGRGQASVADAGLDGACTPLAGAMVDLWQCGALGIYSDVRDPGFNTVGTTFLRGAQVTDADGVAEVLTIYPGWYQGRTVHVLVKVCTHPDDGAGIFREGCDTLLLQMVEEGDGYATTFDVGVDMSVRPSPAGPGGPGRPGGPPPRSG